MLSSPSGGWSLIARYAGRPIIGAIQQLILANDGARKKGEERDAATADAADDAGGQERLASDRCRRATRGTVSPQPAVGRSGAGPDRTALDRGCRRRQARAGAALWTPASRNRCQGSDLGFV